MEELRRLAVTAVRLDIIELLFLLWYSLHIARVFEMRIRSRVCFILTVIPMLQETTKFFALL